MAACIWTIRNIKMKLIVFKNILGIGAASASNIFFTALQSLMLGRILNVESFGVTRSATAYMILLSMLGHFTLHNALASFIVRARNQEDVSAYIYHATVLVFIISTLVASISIMVISCSGYWQAPLRIPLIAIISSLPLVCLTISYNACMEALGEFRTYSVVLILTGLIPLVTIALTSKIWLLEGWIAGRLISATLLLLLSAYVIRAHLQPAKLQLSYCVNLFKFARMQIFSGIFSLVLMSADVILLERLGNDLTAVANYGVALLFTNACAFLPTALGRVYFKEVAANGSEGDQKRFEYILLVATLALVTALTLYWVGPVLIQLFFGKNYMTASSIIRALSFGVIFNYLWNCISVINVSMGYPRRSVTISFVGATIGLAALIYLIPTYRGIGAAWAMNAAYGAGVTVGLYLLWSQRSHVETLHAN